MKIGAAIAVVFVLVVAAFSLDHGVYIGSDRVVMGAPCCANLDYIQKRCKFLFVTGVSEIDAPQGQVMAPNAMKSDAAEASGRAKPDNGYCPLFAK